MRSSAVVLALTLTLTLACGGDDLLLPADGGAARIAIAGGNNQNGAVGATLAESISVLVSDATGRPVMGQPVAFAVTAGDGARLTPDTVTTGADGRAGARWVLGRDVGTQRAEAVAVTGDATASPSVAFSASASPGSAHAIARVSGDGQTAVAGSALPDSLVVRVTDQFGNAVGGIEVTWTATGGGSVSSGRVTTAANGRAAVRRTLGSQAGQQGTTASVSGLNGSPVTFAHTATSPGGGGGGGGGGGDDPSVAIVSGDDQTAKAGTELPNPLVIRVTDGSGRGLSGASVVWVVTDGGGSVQPAFTTTDSEGRASTRWTLGGSPGQNRLSAVVAGVGTVDFEARGTPKNDADDRAVRLSFLVQPSDAEEDQRISPAVQVAAVNAGGERVGSAVGDVEIRLGPNADEARLRGDPTERLDGGVATFSDLRLDQVDDDGGTFTLIAGTTGLPDAESAPFRIGD